jgi:uncharacterized protein YjbJ (UPF0337 family)
MTNTNIDTAIGRVREAFGTLTESKRLKRERHVEGVGGSVDDAVTRVAVFTDSASDNRPE